MLVIVTAGRHLQLVKRILADPDDKDTVDVEAVLISVENVFPTIEDVSPLKIALIQAAGQIQAAKTGETTRAAFNV